MTHGFYTVEANRPLTDNVWEMRLAGDTSAIQRPGQFVNIKLEGLFLRRPISVCDWDEETLTILYKTVGKGTEAMRGIWPGKHLDLLCGLGNGFAVEKCGARTLVIGGGVGVPPLYGLAKALLRAGKTPVAILGFNRADEVFYEDKFRALGMETVVTTVDGSYGRKGFVTDALPEQYDSFCACGPEAMLKAVCRVCDAPGQVSLEERMGCGFGACMGCTCRTKQGSKRICREGPVLEKEELLW